MSFNNRQNVNRSLLKVLEAYIEENPDTRFGQALINLGFTMPMSGETKPQVVSFYEESSSMAQRVINNHKRNKAEDEARSAARREVNTVLKPKRTRKKNDQI